MNLKEEDLKATTNRQVVKIGDTVHRKVNGDPLLHLYLQYLEDVGMEGVPRFLGLDEQGLEILTYLPGKTMGTDYPSHHPCLHSDEAIIDMASFMRRLHDVSEGFLPKALEYGWGNPDYPQDKPETICHNDAAIWNWVFVNDRLTGLYDFDNACPGTRMWDLTLPVFSIIPLTPYDYEPKSDTEIKYDRLKHASERMRRIRLFFEAYGMNYSHDFLDLLYLRMLNFCKNSKGVGLVWYQKVAAHIKETGHWI